MFLTVGQKLKQLRKEYEIKQLHFVEHGFSRNYISMIETEQRTLNQEKLSQLYDALCKLTGNKVKEQYSIETFIADPEEQAIKWLEKNGTVEYGLNHSSQYLDIVNQYEQFYYGYVFEEKLSQHYHQEEDYVSSYDHAQAAISYSIKASQNPAGLYELAGINLFKLGNYSDAIFQFKMAINSLIDDKDPYLYKLKYNIALCHLYSDHYEQALEMIDEVIDQNQNLQTKAAAYMVKESMLKKIGHFEEGREVLWQFINHCFYESYLAKAYHNLGCNYMDDRLYEEALEAFENALKYHQTDSDRLLTESVMGNVYFELKDLVKSEEVFNRISDKIFEIGYTYQKETVLEWGVNLYWELKDIEKISILLTKSKQLVRDGKSHQHIVTAIQNGLYEKIMEQLLENPDYLSDYEIILNDLKE